MNPNIMLIQQLLQLLNDPSISIEINNAIDKILVAVKKGICTISTSEYLPEITDELANITRTMYSSYVKAGFTPEQAIDLIINIRKK